MRTTRRSRSCSRTAGVDLVKKRCASFAYVPHTPEPQKRFWPILSAIGANLPKVTSRLSLSLARSRRCWRAAASMACRGRRLPVYQTCPARAGADLHPKKVRIWTQ